MFSSQSLTSGTSDHYLVFSEPSSDPTLELTAMEGVPVNFDMARVIDKLRASLPSPKPQSVTELPTLCLHTLVYASLLQILQGDLLCHREVCDGLVSELIALIRELWDHDYKILEPIMGVRIPTLLPISWSLLILMRQLCWQWLVEHLLDRVRRQNEHDFGQLGELIKFTLLAMNKLAWELPVVCTFFPCLFHSLYILLNSCSSCQYCQRRCSVQ